MKNRKPFTIIMILEILIFLIIFIGVLIRYQSVEVRDANVNLSNSNKLIQLAGEWEYYSDQYLYTDEVSEGTREIINLPVLLTNKRNINAGTYQLTINLENDVSRINIHAFSISGNYRIFIDGKLYFSNFNSRMLPTIIELTPDDITNNSFVLSIELYNNDFEIASINDLPSISFTANPYSRYYFGVCFIMAIIAGLFALSLIQLDCLLSTNKQKYDILFIVYTILITLHIITNNNIFQPFFRSLSFIPISIHGYINLISLSLSMLIIYLTYSIRTDENNRHQIKFYDALFLIVLVVASIAMFIVDKRDFFVFSIIFYIFNILIIVTTIINIALKKISKEVKTRNIGALATVAVLLMFDLLVNLKVIVWLSFELTPIILFFISLNHISNTINSNTMKIYESQEISRLKDQIRNTEFTFLNSQIQSHFIYNTLNSIQSLCHTNPHKAAALVEEFSSYLRTRLEFNKMPVLINIADELENIRTYLNIEKERFGERINYQFDLKVADFMVPPLSIQPLVENSIKHGISKKVGGGTVFIRTYEDQKNIYVEVEDNGTGFDIDKLSDRQRVGTTNIRHRFELHLNAKLVISSKVGVGTKAVVTIPKP